MNYYFITISAFPVSCAVDAYTGVCSNTLYKMLSYRRETALQGAL